MNAQSTTENHEATITAFLQTHFLGALATHGCDGANVCTIHCAYGEENTLFFKSRNKAEHIRELDSRAALALYDHDSTCEEKFGVQLRGVVERVKEAHDIVRVRELFARHPTLKSAAEKIVRPEDFIGDTEAGIYRFIITRRKLVDTRKGKRTYTEWLPKVVVHILQGGFSLCNFRSTLCQFWPADHKWVPFQDSAQVNCPICQEVLKKLQK